MQQAAGLYRTGEAGVEATGREGSTLFFGIRRPDSPKSTEPVHPLERESRL